MLASRGLGLLRRRTRVSPYCRLSSRVNAPEELIEECLKLRADLQPLNDRIRGPLDKGSTRNTAMPFVFLLGNHSSGKSSFVNYVCGRKVQTAGVAPTDDNFTVIVPGPADGDRDGPAFIGDPDLGFSGLRSFGPALIHHTCLKIRSGVSIQDFAIVDSPGMIDSPRVRTSTGAGHKDYQLSDVMDRGYDFEDVCKWFAQRADVILLFFDPDKPGTTGETLSILTNALQGMDHKLHIILNKADQFHKMSDFARAYGSLCWNLSKVIQRKDLPRIYTMCLPPSARARGSTTANAFEDDDGVSYSSNNAKGDWASLDRDGQGLVDLETTREDVVKEVLSAPKRRVLNEISRLADDAQLLQLHYRVADALTTKHQRTLLKWRLVTAGVVMGGAGSTAAAVFLELPPQVPVGMAGATVVATLFSWWFGGKSVEDETERLCSPIGLDEALRTTVAPRDRSAVDEYAKALWNRAREQMLGSFGRVEVEAVAGETSRGSRAADMDRLKQLLDVEIPQLRRQASPQLAPSGKKGE